MADLRKELTNIRSEASNIEGLEALKLRLETVVVETKLVETFATLLSKNLEVLGALSK